VATKTPREPTVSVPSQISSAVVTVIVGSLKSLTTVVGYLSPSPENLASDPPMSSVTPCTPVAVSREPPEGVNPTPVQFICRLVADMWTS
jgi:hypothetical protein